jgi:hypothetical protein
MSVNFHFYVETRASGEWTCPDAFPAATVHGLPRGEFTWIKASSRTPGLFFGEGALFPFRPEHPPFTPASELFRTLYPEGWKMGDREIVLSWIPFEELIVDLWDETRLLVGNRVPASVAALFGDGNMSFPGAALAAAGWEQHAIDRLREGGPAIEAIPRSTGPGRREVDASHPERPLEVTWTDTVAGCLGRRRADAFRSLRQHGTDTELRVISIYW